MGSGFVKTQGVVLHRLPFSDTSMVVKVYTPDLGLVPLLAKGLRRKDSPMRSSLEPLVHCSLELSVSPRRELQIPREAVVINAHLPLRADIESWAKAEVMAEAVLRMASGGHHQGVFEILQQGLMQLEQSQSPEAKVDPRTLVLFFARLAEELGYAFSLVRCTQCNRPHLQSPAELDPQHGGGLCAECLDRKALWPQYLRDSLFDFALDRPIENTQWARLEDFYHYYLRLHHGMQKSLHSMEHLATIRGMEGPRR